MVNVYHVDKVPAGKVFPCKCCNAPFKAGDDFMFVGVDMWHQACYNREMDMLVEKGFVFKIDIGGD